MKLSGWATPVGGEGREPARGRRGGPSCNTGISLPEGSRIPECQLG